MGPVGFNLDETVFAHCKKRSISHVNVNFYINVTQNVT